MDNLITVDISVTVFQCRNK